MNIVNHTHCTHSMVSCGCVETDILSKHVSLLANLFDLLMVLLLSLIVNSLYSNVLVVVAMVKWNIFMIIIVIIITSFSHRIFEYVLHVKYHPLFSFSASLFSTIPYHSYDHLLSLIHFLTKSCCLEIPLVATNMYRQTDGSFLYTCIRYMYIHVDSIGQSTLLGIIG